MHRQPPLVTILLPAYNAGKTLESCLKSILRQTFTRWHCLVLDDGSNDHTLEIAHQFAIQDPRFEVVSLPHQGLIDTLNAGIDRLETPYVARMDSDDLMHRERLQAQFDLLTASPYAAVGSHVRLFPRRQCNRVV